MNRLVVIAVMFTATTGHAALLAEFERRISFSTFNPVEWQNKTDRTEGVDIWYVTTAMIDNGTTYHAPQYLIDEVALADYFVLRGNCNCGATSGDVSSPEIRTYELFANNPGPFMYYATAYAPELGEGFAGYNITDYTMTVTRWVPGHPGNFWARIDIYGEPTNWFAAWRAQYGMAGKWERIANEPHYLISDWNQDEVVDTADYVLMRKATTIAAVAVPECSTLQMVAALCIAGLIMLAWHHVGLRRK